ncbi:tetratricopeptide repeat protein [Congregibacter variabilis]|uniref:Tetratricopeptide repeat protein n=1 Tax=Congregibacter variabilis TaxID=3081200 RepID=A0ABZ0I2K4_9GAMM|nr:tetratricopeptide repeat protein [Congregibacter sp. IMCC43200]
MPELKPKYFRALLLALGLLFLGACASGPAPVSPEAPEANLPRSRVPTPTLPTDSTVSPAVSPVDSLLEEARAFREGGNLSASFARLERALRIAPQRAEVYLELARSHDAAGRPQRASASAERGLLYCSSSTCAALRKFIES